MFYRYRVKRKHNTKACTLMSIVEGFSLSICYDIAELILDRDNYNQR